MSLRPATLLRLAISLALLGALLTQLDPASVAARLGALDPRWLIPALLLTVAQVVASAWRWRFTAARLGLELPLQRAIREYYLATFANQVLPGGVLGDIGRAGRHAAASGAPGPAARAVVLERASGQLAAGAIAVVALPLAMPRLPGATLSLLALVGALTLALIALGLHRARRRPQGLLGITLRDARRALLGRAVLPVQLVASLGIAASYVGVYGLVGLALGTPAPGTWLPLVPFVLLAMVVPISIAGWGVREGVAAGAWLASGLDPAAGTALSIAYGLVILVSSVPGLFVLLTRGRPGHGEPESNAVREPT